MNKRAAVNGIVLLNKPTGRTSNHALQEVKRIFRARKAGHTGSLDPLASGLLPVCLGEATKVSTFLLDADKRYSLTARFGERTTTGDAEGEIIARRGIDDLNAQRVREVLEKFRGRLRQIPPMYSAVKRQGQPLYKLARRGIEVEREARDIEVFEFEVTAYQDAEYCFELHCSKGTYVRTLVDDIGERLGCGAHVRALCRTGIGVFQAPEQTGVTLQQLHSAAESGADALAQYLLPLDAALVNWPDVTLTSDMVFYVRQGQAVQVPRAPTSGFLRLYARDGSFVGMGRVQEDGKIAPKRLLAR
ncbi:MAG: tRNA pseudouridine(55) synthase TruB [Gammaproteobacteria bacterium]|nr:tRNA pseudouridine(55) synthase TruB [Gammaproteobacteria bacterium]